MSNVRPNMVSLRYRGKYNAALYALAVREGDVRQRLRGAYRELRVLREDEVPESHREEWVLILSMLVKRGPLRRSDGEVYKSALDHTLDQMRNSSGRKIAECIYSLVRCID